jgi:hypothetical protein
MLVFNFKILAYYLRALDSKRLFICISQLYIVGFWVEICARHLYYVYQKIGTFFYWRPFAKPASLASKNNNKVCLLSSTTQPIHDTCNTPPAKCRSRGITAFAVPPYMFSHHCIVQTDQFYRIHRVLGAPFPCWSAFTTSFVSSDLSAYFGNVIECGVHRCNSFRMGTNWAVYRVEHIIYVSLQVFLHRISFCKENLVKGLVKFGPQNLNLAYPFRTFRVIIVKGSSQDLGCHA